MEHWSHEKKQEDLFVLLNSFVFVSLVPNADLFLQLVLNATISKLWMDFWMCYFLIKDDPLLQLPTIDFHLDMMEILQYNYVL